MVLNTISKNRLVLALQKQGRLSDDSLTLLQECGIDISKGKLKLRSSARNFPMEILFLRDDDLPGCVERGEADIAIVGENVLEESGSRAEVLVRLGFGRCRLSLAVPREMRITSPRELAGLSIATSYPSILSTFLSTEGIQATIKSLSGSVEIAPGIEMAEAIFDIVDSGSTLTANGLRELATVFRSEAVLIRSPNLIPEKVALLDSFTFRVNAVLRGRKSKYILLNAPDSSIPEITKILPGIKSPTLMPLAEPGWSSLHAVVSEEGFWTIVEDLKKAGAEGILVTSIEKVVL